MAINPLQPTEIEAWARLMQIEPTPWEVRTLLRMDQAFLARVMKPKKKPGLQIEASDTQGVAALMASFKGRKPNGGMKKIEVQKDT